MGNTAPSVIGSRNLFECQLAASGPVSASPSPITQKTLRSGLSKAAPYACVSAYPSSPPSWIEPGVSGAAWLGMPPGNENCLNSRCIPPAQAVNGLDIEANVPPPGLGFDFAEHTKQAGGIGRGQETGVCYQFVEDAAHRGVGSQMVLEIRV